MIITGTRVRGGRYYGGTASATTDEYFNLVSLLLPGNGTNGAQNNTFLDSSTNNFAITRNGNTTQGTFSPFRRVFINGTQLSSTVTNSTNWAAITRIGAIDSGDSQNFLGYINDFRITKGLARYTANFTPPTTAFPTQ